jgi:hypothetical protein
MREQRKTAGNDIGAKNARTGLILGAIAAFFFVSVFVKHIWFS